MTENVVDDKRQSYWRVIPRLFEGSGYEDEEGDEE